MIKTERIYYIKINNKPIEVSKEIYSTYDRDRKRIKYHQNKAKENEISINTEIATDLTISDTIEDKTAISGYDYTLHTKLYEAINSLPKDEKDLIVALYFLSYSQQEYYRISGIKQTTISYRKNQILEKLRIMLENDNSNSKTKSKKFKIAKNIK